MKILFILNTANRVNNFCFSSIMAAKELGCEFHVAGNWGYCSGKDKLLDERKNGIKIHQIDFQRLPCHPKNIIAYRQLYKLVDIEHYDVIHCNTPIGGLLGRIVAKKMHCKFVIYQAHGFHFYKGSPIFNWLAYYPVERMLAKWTDALAVINKEDYELTKKMKLRKNGKRYYIPSVGIDYSKFSEINNDGNTKRKELGIPADAFLIMSVGELNSNKNQTVILEALSLLNNKDIHYVIVGKGPTELSLRKKTNKLGLNNQVHFLGYRNDINELYGCADLCAFPSIREGLGMAAIEGMASGLPLICSDNAGTRDYAKNNENSIVCKHDNAREFAEGIDMLFKNKDLRNSMGNKNRVIAKRYDKISSIAAIKSIYNDAKIRLEHEN